MQSEEGETGLEYPQVRKMSVSKINRTVTTPTGNTKRKELTICFVVTSVDLRWSWRWQDGDDEMATAVMATAVISGDGNRQRWSAVMATAVSEGNNNWTRNYALYYLYARCPSLDGDILLDYSSPCAATLFRAMFLAIQSCGIEYFDLPYNHAG